MSSICYAENYKMQITLTDGTIEEVDLASKPIVTFTDTTMVISTDSIVCELNKIKNFVFVGDGTTPEEPGEPEEPDTPNPPTGIDHVSKIKISYANRILKIEGVTPEDIITVSSIQGVNQEINPIYNSDTATASLNNLAKGIYIIRIKEQTLKFTIK